MKPKKNNQRKKQPKKAQPKRKKAKLAFSAGGVVFRKTSYGPEVLLTKDHRGNWAVPKGTYELGETAQMTALREVEEETGLDNLRIHAKLTPNKYIFTFDGVLISKTVDLFLMEASGVTKIDKSKLDPDEHAIEDAKWYTPEEALARVDYEDLVDILAEAIDKLKKYGR